MIEAMKKKRLKAAFRNGIIPQTNRALSVCDVIIGKT